MLPGRKSEYLIISQCFAFTPGSNCILQPVFASESSQTQSNIIQTKFLNCFLNFFRPSSVLDFLMHSRFAAIGIISADLLTGKDAIQQFG